MPNALTCMSGGRCSLTSATPICACTSMFGGLTCQVGRCFTTLFCSVIIVEKRSTHDH